MSNSTLFSSFECSLSEHFEVDVGHLVIIGVAPLEQDRTCVAGQTCSFDGIVGNYLSGADKYMVLETCGVVDERWEVSGFPNAGLLTTAASGGTLSWGTAVVSAGGGSYRLCWCSSSATCDTMRCQTLFLTAGSVVSHLAQRGPL